MIATQNIDHPFASTDVASSTEFFQQFTFGPLKMSMDELGSRTNLNIQHGPGWAK